MSDEQHRSLSGYKSKVNDGSGFENPNEGKPLLTEDDEYVLRLTKIPHVIKKPEEKKRQDGTAYTIQTEKAVCIFEEETTKNVIVTLLRVDHINFDPDEKFDSAVVKFFKKIKRPLVKDIEPDWDQYFVVGMRFRSRVVVDRDNNKQPTGKYFLDIPTCRPILASDMHPDATATLSTSSASQKVATVLSLAKGAASAGDAFALAIGKAPQDYIQEFVAADKRGEIKYPIQ